MEELPSGWLAAIALTITSAVLGGGIALADQSLLGSDLTGPPIVLLGGLLAVFAALATRDESPLTDR